jgi:hypothetical protein
VALALATPRGWAQVAPQKVAADAAFDEGKRLMAEGKIEAACPRFAESQRLDPASSTLLWLGECLEKTGKLASAWSTFREAASLATRQGKADREKLARERVAALEPRVPRLVLLPGKAPDGLVATLDGVEIGRALWKTPLPVDPGAHALVLRAPGRQETTLTIQVRAGDPPRELLFPELSTLAPPPASASAAPKSPPVGSTAPAPAGVPSGESNETAPGLSGRQIGGLALGGAGLILGVVGGVLQGGARSKADDARARRDRPLFDEAGRQQTVAISAMIAGGALLTGGAILFFLPSSSARTSSAVRLVPQVSQRASTLWLTGSFLPCAFLFLPSPCSWSLPVASVSFPKTSPRSRAPEAPEASRPARAAPTREGAPARAAPQARPERWRQRPGRRGRQRWQQRRCRHRRGRRSRGRCRSRWRRGRRGNGGDAGAAGEAGNAGAAGNAGDGGAGNAGAGQGGAAGDGGGAGDAGTAGDGGAGQSGAAGDGGAGSGGAAGEAGSGVAGEAGSGVAGDAGAGGGAGNAGAGAGGVAGQGGAGSGGVAGGGAGGAGAGGAAGAGNGGAAGVGGSSGAGGGCNGGLTLCGGGCVDTLRDEAHCGGCGQVCGGVCVSGECDEVLAIDAGGAHSCARFASGKLRCWGRSGDGQLGYGNTDNVGDVMRPSEAVALPGSVVSMGLGQDNTCAVLEGGALYCWGNGFFTGSWGSTPTRPSGTTSLPPARER